jgi:cysteine desulfurase
MAILGAARANKSRGRHIITSSIEHHAVLHACDYLEREEGFRVTRLPVDRTGRVKVEEVVSAIQPDTILVSIMAANNEMGTLQPVSEIGLICGKRGIFFHTDAVQWFGKEPLKNIGQFEADLVSICGHKFHGPKGAGALYVKSPFKPHPLLLGGSHENEQRAGTENLAAIIGLVEAMERFIRVPVFSRDFLKNLTARLIQTLETIEGVEFVGARDGVQRLPNTVSFVVKGADSIMLLANLDMEGVCASSGAACSAGSLEPSHVVAAMGYEPALAKSFVRFSLGRGSTLEEVETVCGLLPKIIQRSKGA